MAVVRRQCRDERDRGSFLIGDTCPLLNVDSNDPIEKERQEMLVAEEICRGLCTLRKQEVVGLECMKMD